MQKVFFPAIAAWMMFAYWLYTIVYRSDSIKEKIHQLNIQKK
jgi:hypothetical protein